MTPATAPAAVSTDEELEREFAAFKAAPVPAVAPPSLPEREAFASRPDLLSSLNLDRRFPLRPPNQGEIDFFRKSPDVAGYAADDNNVVLNPFSTLDDEQKQAVALNERLRLHMDEIGSDPKFPLTARQRKLASSMGAYGSDESLLRKTIVARLLSGDDSLGPYTQEQRREAGRIVRAAPAAPEDAALESDFAKFKEKQARIDSLKEPPSNPIAALAAIARANLTLPAYQVDEWAKKHMPDFVQSGTKLLTDFATYGPEGMDLTWLAGLFNPYPYTQGKVPGAILGAEGVGRGVVSGLLGTVPTVQRSFGMAGPEPTGFERMAEGALTAGIPEPRSGAEYREQHPLRIGKTFGQTIAGVGTAQAVLPLALQGLAIRTIGSAFGWADWKQVKGDAWNLLTGILPPLGGVAELRQIAADKDISDEDKARAYEEWWTTQAPALLAVTGVMAHGLGKSVKARRAAVAELRKLEEDWIERAQESQRTTPSQLKAAVADIPENATPAQVAEALRPRVGQPQPPPGVPVEPVPFVSHTEHETSIPETATEATTSRLSRITDAIVEKAKQIVGALREEPPAAAGEPTRVVEPEPRPGAVGPAVSPMTREARAMSGIDVKAAFKAATGRMGTDLLNRLGTTRERFRRALGPVTGDAEYYRMIEFLTKREMAETEWTAQVGKVLTREDVWKTLNKIPYINPAQAANISYSLRRIPVIGYKFGVARSEMARLSDAVEGIKELAPDGTPVFGTRIFLKEKKMVDGKEKWELTGDFRWRFTEEQARANWERLSPDAKNAAKWWVTERETIKKAYEISSGIEGYLHHYFEQGLINGFRNIALHKTTAAPLRMRREAEGYVRDFERAVLKYGRDIKLADLTNDFVVEFAKRITEPIDDLTPLKPGWVEVPSYQATRTGKKLGQLGSGRQIPAGLRDDFVRYVEKLQETSEIADTAHALGIYMKGNLLLYPGTFARNIVSGAIQAATGMVERTALHTMQGNFRAIATDAAAPFLALRPSSVRDLPSQLWGARANIAADFGGPANAPNAVAWAAMALAKANSIPLAGYQAIENYWKRAIAIAVAKEHGIAPTAAEFMAHKQAFAAMQNAIDQWAFDYRNVPKGLEKFRSGKGPFGSAGAFILPYPTYGYKLVRMTGRYVGWMNPAVKMTAQDRVARAFTLATMMSMVALASSRKDDKVGDAYDGLPWEQDRSGRIMIGRHGQEGEYLRVTPYPWLNFAEALKAGGRAWNTGKMDSVTDLLGDFLSEGPLTQAINLSWGYEKKAGRYKPPGVKRADIAGAFVPLSRVAQGVRELPGGPKMRAMTFEQRIAQMLPVPASWLGLEAPSKIATERGTKRRIILDPSLEARKFWFGMNIKRISARDYRAEKAKDIVNAMESFSGAQTHEDLDRAARRLREIDPRMFSQAVDRVQRHKILIPPAVADEAEPENKP